MIVQLEKAVLERSEEVTNKGFTIAKAYVSVFLDCGLNPTCLIEILQSSAEIFLIRNIYMHSSVYECIG